jgi:protein SCO1
MIRRAGLTARGAIVGAVALLVLCAVCAGCGGTQAPAGGVTTPSPYAGINASSMRAPNFTLHDQHGQAVTLSAMRGKFVLLTFLYVHCTNVCPVIAEQLNEALLQLPRASRAQVRVLAVSVDPKGDTPSAVAHFIAVHRLLPQFLYLTGTAHSLLPVWNDYHVASVQGPQGLVVGHSALVLLLNRDLKPAVIYDSTVTPEQVLHDLHVLGLSE